MGKNLTEAAADLRISYIKLWRAVKSGKVQAKRVETVRGPVYEMDEAQIKAAKEKLGK